MRSSALNSRSEARDRVACGLYLSPERCLHQSCFDLRRSVQRAATSGIGWPPASV